MNELSEHQPICVNCVQNLKPEENGVLVRLWDRATVRADLWQCPGCGYQIVHGFGAVTHDHEPAFAQDIKRLAGSRIIGTGRIYA